MNGIFQKWLLVLLLIPILLLLLLTRVEGGDMHLNGKPCVALSQRLLSSDPEAAVMPFCRADVFYNHQGLKNEIEIFEPLRELTATAKSTGQSIEELIKDITIWVPMMYYEQFLVQPGCIIILETRINAAGRAEVRFGVAMECTYRTKLANPISI